MGISSSVEAGAARLVIDNPPNLARGRHGWAWTPAPLLEALGQSGEQFGSLNVHSRE